MYTFPPSPPFRRARTARQSIDLFSPLPHFPTSLPVFSALLCAALFSLRAPQQAYSKDYIIVFFLLPQRIFRGLQDPRFSPKRQLRQSTEEHPKHFLINRTAARTPPNKGCRRFVAFAAGLTVALEPAFRRRKTWLEGMPEVLTIRS